MTLLRIPKSWDPDHRRGVRATTPESTYWNRRQVLKALGLSSLGLALPQGAGCILAEDALNKAKMVRPALGKRFANLFPARRNETYTLGGRPLTPEEVPAAYNNFYEFLTNKGKVWGLAQGYPVDPWKVEIAGLVHKPLTLDLDDLFTRIPLEERLYRFRCVERWAMQVPWTGYPLRKLLELAQPLSKARYVRFVSFHDPENLPGQKLMQRYPWPYYEALRLDEAYHELTLVAVGIYGHALPMQHGAPWRLVTPWKYGYKSPKSIVRIELTEEQPPTFWNDLQPPEYGFFSNVDPSKPHPRWSQEVEEDIGTLEKRATLLYNGYAQEVAGLYEGSEW